MGKYTGKVGEKSGNFCQSGKVGTMNWQYATYWNAFFLIYNVRALL